MIFSPLGMQRRLMQFFNYSFQLSFKGATKLYSTHCSCVVTILFNAGLYKSAFSTDSFGKLVACTSVPFALCPIPWNFHKPYNICMIIVYMIGVRYSVFLFSLISKKRYHVITIWIQTHLTKAFNKKHAFGELLSY